MERREFMKLAVAAAVAPPAVSAAASYGVRLGGPVFGAGDDPEQLALAHSKLGYQAAYCPKVAIGDKSRIRAIADAFGKAGVVIAEVGRWVNLLDADPGKRKENLGLVTEGLALADEIGALCCVDIAGSFNAEQWDGPHPENLSERFLEASVENARKIIDAVKPKRARFTYEMMPYALPDSPDSALRMIRVVSRDAFGVHLDPCNIVNSPQRIYETTGLINECFDKLGPWIVSCHAKDVDWGPGLPVHIREVRAGTGKLDYRAYLSRLAGLPQRPPLMLEHLPNAGEYDQARRHIQGMLSR